MIVLNEEQKMFLERCLEKHSKEMEENGMAIVPIPIKGGLYMLPDDLLDLKHFKEVKESLTDHKVVDKIKVREVLKAERIEKEAFPIEVKEKIK